MTTSGKLLPRLYTSGRVLFLALVFVLLSGCAAKSPVDTFSLDDVFYPYRDETFPMWTMGEALSSQEKVDWINVNSSKWVESLINAGDVVYMPSSQVKDYWFLGEERHGVCLNFVLMCVDEPVGIVHVNREARWASYTGCSAVFHSDYVWSGPISDAEEYVWQSGGEPSDESPETVYGWAHERWPSYTAKYVAGGQFLLYKDGELKSLCSAWEDGASMPDNLTTFIYPSKPLADR